MTNLAKAIKLAWQRCGDRYNRKGKRIIEEGCRQMVQMGSETEMIVSILDTAVQARTLTPIEVGDRRFGSEIVLALTFLARNPGIEMEDVARIQANDLACIVKSVKMLDEMRELGTDMPGLDEVERMEKLRNASNILLGVSAA